MATAISATGHDATLGTMAVALGVAGLLPGLPFIGSVAAPVCGYVEAETLRQQRPVTHVTS